MLKLLHKEFFAYRFFHSTRGQNIKKISVKLICVHLKAICVKRLESVETLVSAVVLPVPPDASGPGELGDDPRHGQTCL